MVSLPIWPDELSWDEWRLSDREVERIDLENAANPEEAHKLEEMTANEMAVDGYYVVAGIARQDSKQGWKFLTLWDGYGGCCHGWAFDDGGPADILGC